MPHYVIRNRDNQKKKISLESSRLLLEKYDLIPGYKDFKGNKKSTSNGFYFNYVTGPRYMNSETYFNIGLFPAYKYNNFTIRAKLDFYINSEQKIINANWKDKNSILE